MDEYGNDHFMLVVMCNSAIFSFDNYLCVQWGSSKETDVGKLLNKKNMLLLYVLMSMLPVPSQGWQ
jgi:hypothetical protein